MIAFTAVRKPATSAAKTMRLRSVGEVIRGLLISRLLK
jgi:hypothetical protein